MSRLALLSSFCLLLPLGCGDETSDSASEGSGTTDGSGDGADDDADGGDADADGGDADADGGDDSDDTAGEGTTSDTGADADTGEPPTEPTLARDIEITLIEADNGIAVQIMDDGAEVPLTSRDVHLPKNRDTMIRLQTEVGPGWVPRKIRAELTLVEQDGTETLLKSTVDMDGDYYLDDLVCVGGVCDPTTAKFFFFGAESLNMTDGVEYKVSLWEAETGMEDTPEPDPPPMFPADGSTLPVGVDPDYLDLEIVMVPIAYQSAECTQTPDVSDAKMQRYIDDLYQVNAAETLTFTVRDPLDWSNSLANANGLSSLVSGLGQLRQQDGAEPWQYYYGLIDNCGECIVNYPGCIVGMAGGSRASAGLISPGPGTFTHEVGHTQGRSHVGCPAPSAGNDPSYPYPDGVIDDWGFGIRDFGLRARLLGYDYMSYCGPGWASDWQWEATYEVIHSLSSMKEGSAPIPEGTQLVGVIEPDGSQQWWTERAIKRNAVMSATDTVQFLVGNQVVTTAHAGVAFRSHHAARELYIDLPPDLDMTTMAIVYDDGETRHGVLSDEIKVLHAR